MLNALDKIKQIVSNDQLGACAAIASGPMLVGTVGSASRMAVFHGLPQVRLYYIQLVVSVSRLFLLIPFMALVHGRYDTKEPVT